MLLLLHLLVIFLSVLGSSLATWQFGDASQSQKLAATALKNAQAYHKSHRTKFPNRCTIDNAARRREWSSLCDDEKRQYIAAIQCLMTKPSLSRKTFAPGARSRYDDFLAVHINQTLTIHATGNFLSWHRWFLHSFEHALQTECAYSSTVPYVNWALYAHDIISSPLFTGSDTSLSGNGSPYKNLSPLPFPNASDPVISVPPSEGGGCITTGPFANATVNLGPAAAVLPDVPPNPRHDGLGYNPRCIRRDLSNRFAAWTSDSNITSLIADNRDIACFQTVMQGEFAQGQLGVHTGGHYWVGGDPGGDFFASPGDPWFWSHHAMIDRCWWIWQNLCPGEKIAERESEIAGTLTLFNVPPSRNATLRDFIDVGEWNGEMVRIEEVVSTVGEKLCYVYE